LQHNTRKAVELRNETIDFAVCPVEPRCRSCASGDIQVIRKGLDLETPHPYPLSGDMCLFVCGRCGFIGAQTSSTEVDYTDYYTNYNKHHIRQGSLSELDKKYFEKVINFIKGRFPLAFDRTRVLDFGSGARLFSSMAMNEGASVASNLDLGVPLNGSAFDLVVSTHCFEHVLDFRSEFARIRSILRDDGVFCIAVPDVRGYTDYYYGPYNCFDLEHINHFDCDSLCAALQEQGLSAVAVMESERLVTPTLAYPEVLVLARRESVGVGLDFRSSRNPVDLVLKNYLDKSFADMTMGLAFARGVFEQDAGKGGGEVAYGLYGLSSYAFRLLRFWDNSEIPLTWFADSDGRLKGKTIRDVAIFDSGEFATFASRNSRKGIKTVCFLASVNAYRIAEFLSDLQRENALLEVVVLPPDCQNRVN
jgi:hypothetical protein